jgi:hypothetical protein
VECSNLENPKASFVKHFCLTNLLYLDPEIKKCEKKFQKIDNNEETNFRLKIAVIGPRKSGKSCAVTRIVEGIWGQESNSTHDQYLLSIREIKLACADDPTWKIRIVLVTLITSKF